MTKAQARGCDKLAGALECAKRPGRELVNYTIERRELMRVLDQEAPQFCEARFIRRVGMDADGPEPF
jgi:hypothetical protein